jgi:fluoroacetyl-CoA thioesterase
MMEIAIGLKGTKEMVVETADLASFGGGGNVGAEVLSTPRLIRLMEQAARDAVVDALPEGMMTVGTMIQMKHLAATPLGVKVRAEAYLKEVDRRRLVFDVVVYDEFEKIAEGVNERFVVSIDKFLEKVKKKQADKT